MKSIFLYIFLSLAYIIFCLSCANEMAPQGGPKDTAAPKLKARSVQDSSVNFKGGKVIFEFDEKIDTKNIIVETFPIMKSKPTINVNKNVVSINIPDSLLEENTTYKISLGNSIKDIYEGNAYNSLSFTFSTGASLDTMNLSGTVLQANSGDADTSAWIFLYPKISNDSDIIKIKPLYASKVDAAGNFTINNLPNKEFYMYAIGDINKNLKYDYAAENIGYLNTSVLPLNVTTPNLLLYTFMENNIDSSKQKNARTKSRVSGIAPRFKINIDSNLKATRSYDITQAITINFAQKLKSWDASKIRLLVDSMIDETGILVYDSIQNKLVLNIDFNQDAIYQLQLLDSFAVDSVAFKGANFIFKTKKESDYGTLKVKYRYTDNSYNQVMQLYQNNTLIAKQIIKDSVMNFKLLSPGNYVIRILHDKNNNEVWDNGAYLNGKKQAERVEKYASDITIKSNWLNVIVWDEKKKDKR